MAKAFYTQGNTLVKYDNSELGYAENAVKIVPRFHHKDIYADDFGPDSPALILWMLADFTIEMTLVYFDQTVIYNAIKDAMGGGTLGQFAGAGTPINGKQLDIESSTDATGNNWSFPKAYLAERPMEWPLGNERSLVHLTFRAVGLPTAAAEVKSSGITLFS